MSINYNVNMDDVPKVLYEKDLQDGGFLDGNRIFDKYFMFKGSIIQDGNKYIRLDYHYMSIQEVVVDEESNRMMDVTRGICQPLGKYRKEETPLNIYADGVLRGNTVYDNYGVPIKGRLVKHGDGYELVDDYGNILMEIDEKGMAVKPNTDQLWYGIIKRPDRDREKLDSQLTKDNPNDSYKEILEKLKPSENRKMGERLLDSIKRYVGLKGRNR